MKKNFGKRFLSILLSVLMVVTMLPTFAVAALADDDKAVKEYMTDENKTGFEGTATWSDEYKAWSFDGTQYIKLDGAPLSGVTATSGFAISFDVLNEDESLNNRYFNFSDGTNGISMVGSNTEWVHRYRTDIKSGDYTRRYYSSDFIDDDYCIKTASTYGNNIYDIHKWNTMTVVMTADGYYSYYKDGELVATFRNNYVDTPNGDYVTDEDAANAIAGATDYFIGASDADANEGFKGYIRNVKIAVGTTYETAIKAYKQKMDGTIYNNMTAPYNAFIDANEAYDAYTYGEGTAADLNSASAALVAAALNMKPWNSAFDAKAYHEGNVADNGYSNVVYCSTGTSWNGSDAYNNLYTTIGSQNVKIAMPTNIVFAYDGVNDVYGPIVFEHTRNGSHNTNTKWVGADSSDWEMRDYWLGYIDNSSDANAYQQWPGTTITDITKTTGYSSTAEPDNLNYFGYSEASYKQNATSNTGNTRFYWNKLYFKGTPDTTKYYTKTYRQTFHMVGWQDNWFDSGNREGTIYSDNTQYVINYAPAYAQLTSSNSDTVKGKLDAIKNEGAIPVENYLSGGLSSVLGAIDALIAANPKNYDYSSDVEATVINCGLDIRTALNSASSSTVTPDGTGYEALREAITLTKPTYERGNSDNYYYAKLWNVFYKAFEAAQSNMTNLPTDGYSANSSAQNLADVLNEAYYELTNVIEENGESGNTEYTYDSETETLNIEPKDGTDGRMEDYDSANDSPFGNSTEVKEIVIDPSVTYIGAHAFDGLKNLETVTVPAGATYGEGAFANCPKLKTVIIVGTDGASEVRNVSKQDSPWILPTVTTVKLGEKLTDKSVTAIENDVFKDKTGTNFFVFNENATIPDEEGMFGGTAVIHGFSTSTAKDYYDNHTADSDFKQLDHGGAHEWTTPVTVLPTCTVDGYTQHVCKICDVVETYDTVDKLEHDWDEGETTPSTCTVEGFTIYTCKRCSSQKTDKIAPLDHDFTVFVETVAPTCTAQGYDVYKCSRCDATENKNETPVDPNAHDYQYSSTVAPTCSAVGYDIYTCSRCNATENRNEQPVDPDAHKYSFDKTVAPTCKNAGYDSYICDYCNKEDKRNPVDPNPNAHNYQYTSTVAPTCTTAGYDIYTCSLCGATENRNEQPVNPTAHDYHYSSTVAPTCSAVGYDIYTCSRCNATENRNEQPVVPTAHNYQKTSTVAPTCTTQGYDVYTCSYCSDSYNEYNVPVNPDAHNYQFDKTVAPTCKNSGYDLYVCEYCSKDDKRNPVDPDPTAHDYQFTETVAPTCTTVGYDLYTCSLCGATENRNEQPVDPTAHDYQFTETVAPTCSAVGYDIYTCSRCNATENRNEQPVNPDAHNFSVFVETVAPTCIAGGYDVYKCKYCEATTQINPTPIDPDAHNFSVFVETVAPTCIAGGYDVYKCEYCEATTQINQTPIDPNAHDYVKGSTVAPTCEAMGYSVYTCSVCNASYKGDYVNSLGHDWDDGVVTVEPTLEDTGVKVLTCKRDKSHTMTVTLPVVNVAPIPTDAEADSAPVNKEIKQPANIVTVCNTNKKLMNISFDRIAGAQNYRIAYRKQGAKKWTYRWTGGRPYYVIKKLKKNGLYEFKFAAYKKVNGQWQRGDWSKTSYRYFYKTVAKKVKAGKKSATISWKKDKNASYYVVFYSTRKDMLGEKKIKVSKNKTSYTIKNLKKGKKYYVRVRAYKTKAKKNYAGQVSATKKVKVK